MNEQKPTIFIGSSVEGKKYAEAIENTFFHDKFDIQPWYRLFKKPLIATIDQLEDIKSTDFGIIIFTPDDLGISRDKEYIIPRDNLVFELGLLIAYLGRNRVFPVIPDGIKIKLPTDLLGVNFYKFHFSKDYTRIDQFEQAMAVACSHIRDHVENEGKRANIVGQEANKFQSGIKFHPNIIYNLTSQQIRFKFAYNGQGNLIDVKIKAYYRKTYKSSVQNVYNNNYDKLDLNTEELPELRLSWSMGHHVTKKSPLLKETNRKINLETLKNIKGKIILYVSGTDSLNSISHFNSMEYSLKDLKLGVYKSFVEITPNGDILYETINWDNFNKMIEK